MKNLFNPKNLIYFSIFCSPLYLIRFNFLGIPTNVLELIILFSFFVWLLKNFKKININPYHEYLLPLLLLLTGLILSALFGEDLLISLGIIKGWFFFPLILSFLIIQKIRTKNEIINVLYAIYFSSVLVGIIALTYLFFGSLTYDLRLKAFYLSPNHLAMFLAPGILIGIFFLLKNLRKKNRQTLLLTIFLLILVLSFYYTYSYAAWVSVLMAIFFSYVISARNYFKKIILATFLFFLFCSLIFFTQQKNTKLQDLINFEERSSLSSRIMIWNSSREILKDNWLLGIGPGNFQIKYLEYQKYFPPYLDWAVPQPHNLYLAFWLQGGLASITGLIWLISFWIKKIATSNVATKNTYLKTIILGTMFYFLIHGLFDTTYWKNDLSLLFWCIFSLGIMYNKNLQKNHKGIP